MVVNEILSEVKPSEKYSEGRRILKVFWGRKLAMFGLVLVVLLILTAILAPILAPYNPDQTNVAQRFQGPSREHLLGTDSIGRDILSRVIFGSRVSLVVGLGAVGMAVAIGQTLGLIAGFFEGMVYNVIMRFVDAFMAIPMILIAMILASVLGSGVKNIIIALGVGMMSGHCRMMCAQILSVKQNDYVLAGKAVGMSNIRLMLSEVLPNAYSPMLVLITIGLGSAILVEATLSYLGIGIPITTPSWGGMINDGQKYLLSSPLISVAPGIAIMLTVFGFNMMGDGLRDALDPRLRGVI